MSIQVVIEQLKERGFKVYGPAPLTTYAYFTPDGVHIGYVQHNREALRTQRYTSLRVRWARASKPRARSKRWSSLRRGLTRVTARPS